MTRSSMLEKIFKWVSYQNTKVICAVFYCLVIIVIFQSKSYPIYKNRPELIKHLLNGSDEGFLPPGKSFEIFKNLIPKNGTVSFILDRPFNSYDMMIENLYAAQTFLAPILINQLPEEPLAIVYCSDRATAEKRMREEHYQMAYPVADGKGLAVKIK